MQFALSEPLVDCFSVQKWCGGAYLHTHNFVCIMYGCCKNTEGRRDCKMLSFLQDEENMFHQQGSFNPKWPRAFQLQPNTCLSRAHSTCPNAGSGWSLWGGGQTTGGRGWKWSNVPWFWSKLLQVVLLLSADFWCVGVGTWVFQTRKAAMKKGR